MLVTAFIVGDLSADDMKQVVAFRCIVKNSLMMDQLLAQLKD